MVLGGAPRAGKGVISARVLREAQVSVFSLDILKMGLHQAVPSVGVEPGADPLEVGRRMWPLVRAMAVNAVECGVDYLFEGDVLGPAQVVELRELIGSELRSCFVGYVDISSATKLQQIREHAGLPNDWLTGHTDEYVREVVEYGIAFSRWLRPECARHDIAYFDGSRSFEDAVDAAVLHLVGAR